VFLGGAVVHGLKVGTRSESTVVFILAVNLSLMLFRWCMSWIMVSWMLDFRLDCLFSFLDFRFSIRLFVQFCSAFCCRVFLELFVLGVARIVSQTDAQIGS